MLLQEKYMILMSYGSELPLIMLMILVMVLVISTIWIMSLVDFLKTENMDEDRVVWAIVIVFAGLVGSILWFLIGRPKYKTK
ncbi:MAG: PLDc N-terminal domain-containing protein [Candidatus Hodarchaeales archaeon]